MTTRSGAQPRPWQREPMVWLLIALPLAAVIGSFVTLALAVFSDDGLVVDDYYRQGQEINRVLARDQAAIAQALQADLDVDYASRQVTILLHSAQILPANIDLKFWHATRSGFDRMLELKQAPDGVYRGALPPLVPGHWHVQIEANDWRLVGALQAPTQTHLRIDTTDGR